MAPVANTATSARRPPHLRRAWLFVPGLNDAAQAAALASAADAVIIDLEEMTAAADRPEARQRIVSVLGTARGLGCIGAARINKLSNDGLDDLRGVMPGKPDAIFLPHSETVEQMQALDHALSEHEAALGFESGSTEIVPTIESAKGLVNLGAMIASSGRIRCSMLAVEDLADNFGAVRSPEGVELLYARQRFLIECKAAACVPIDLPCTYRAEGTFKAELEMAKRLGYTAKSAVFVPQVALIQNALCPSSQDVEEASRVVAGFLAQTGKTYDAADSTQTWIDSPVYNNARRVLARHAAFEAFQPSAADATAQ